MMRKLTATILGTAVLAGGALAGVAAAAPPSHHHHASTQMQTRERSSIERTHREAATNHERAEHGR